MFRTGLVQFIEPLENFRFVRATRCKLAWYFLDNGPGAHYRAWYNRELSERAMYNDSGPSAADAIVNVNRSR